MSNLVPSKWQILHSINLGKSMLIIAKPVEEPAVCPHCGTRCPPKQAYGTRTIRLVDLPVSHKPRLVVAQRKRFRCLACKRIWLQHLPEVDEKHRLFGRAVDYIRREALHRTHSSIARELGINTKTVFNVVADWINEMEESYRPKTPEALGIDETMILGQRRCVFTNLLSGQVLDLLERRTRREVRNWLLGLDNPQQIKLASIVPWNGYRAAIRDKVPQANILIDKAHTLRMATRCLDHYRQAFKRKLPPTECKSLRRDQFLLLTSEKDLKADDVRLRDSWLPHFPLLQRAYRLKEDFSTVYEAGNRREAQERYSAWETSIPAELRHAFRPLTTTMRTWQEEVFNYFNFKSHGVLSISKPANRSIADLIKSGRGYSFKILRGKVLYSSPPNI